MPAVDLHVLQSFAVLRQSTNFLRKWGGGGFSGLKCVEIKPIRLPEQTKVEINEIKKLMKIQTDIN